MARHGGTGVDDRAAQHSCRGMFPATARRSWSALYLGPSTVRNHRSVGFKKLGVHSGRAHREAAVVRARM